MVPHIYVGRNGVDVVNPENRSDFRTVRGYQMENALENKFTAAMEDYLEMVFRLCKEDGYTRVGRLADQLQVNPSSASKMVSKLTQMGYLRLDRNDSILLTDQGMSTGQYLLMRHDTVERFLSFLKVSSPLREAEMLEHAIEPETTKKLQNLLEFLSEYEALYESWLLER